MRKTAKISAIVLGCAVIITPADAQSSSGIDQNYLDKSAVAGDDFNRYANGAWQAKAEIPSDFSSIGVGYEVFLKAEKRDADIIRSAGQGTPRGDARKVADYYHAYLDIAGIKRAGLAPMQAELRAIAALRDKRELATMLGANLRADTDPINATSFWTENLFGLFVTQDVVRPTVTVPYLMQGGLGMPDRDYYLSDKPAMVEVRTAYKAYVTRLLQLSGFTDAQTCADRVFALENRIAAAQADIEASQDAHVPRRMARLDLARFAPGLDWDAFFTGAHLPMQQQWYLWQPDAIAKMAALVRSEPLRDWQDWLIFHRLNQVASILPQPFDDARFDFYSRTLYGIPTPRSRDRRAIGAVNLALGDAVGRLYVARYFPASSKTDIQVMATNIIAAFDARLSKLDWMAPATKAEARRKLLTLNVGIGYPEHWRDYSRLEIRADDPLGNQRRSELAEYIHQIHKLGRPVDRSEWWMTPQTVDAVNLPLQNALNFPAAILESPFYDPAFDAAARYGSIGAIIGHEISHSFDSLGANIDSRGLLRNWWTTSDLKHFQQAGRSLAIQYNAYIALPGLQLKGQQELAENIADLAGLAAAYDAYHASLHGQPAPVIDGLTGDQRFFLAFGQAWRSKLREKGLRARVATDVHAPPMFRIQTVRNMDAWYPAFQVTPGEKLYLAPTERLKVW